MGGERKFGASIGDILKAKQEPKPSADAPPAKPGTVQPESEQKYTPEEQVEFENMREVLNRLSFAKRSKEGLTSMELSDLDIVLAQLKDIATERYDLKENEHYAIFQESLDAKTGLPSLVSREKGRKIIIMDRQAKVKPTPGKRYKVRVVKDTAPGQNHGVMFVELVEAGN